MVGVRPDDPHDLDRFLSAQDDGGTYERALAELRAGRKRSHWMWFVFPQLAGLGRSADVPALRDLGRWTRPAPISRTPSSDARLRECADALAGADDAEGVLGGIDALKLRSSLTLFELAAPDDAALRPGARPALRGERDAATLRLAS